MQLRTLGGVVTLVAAFAAAPLFAQEPEPLLPQMGLLCIGEDTLAVGRLQQSLEAKLAVGEGYQLRVAAELAGKIGVAAHLEEIGDDASEAEMTRLLEQAKQAYYDGELETAHQKLEELRGLQTARPATTIDARVSAMVWHAAVYAARSQNARARNEAVAALTIQPDLELDRVEFPPSAVALVQETRRALEMATIEIVGLPVGARVRIDRRLMKEPARFAVPVGTHELWVDAGGFRPHTSEIDVESDQTIEIALPIAIDLEDQAELVRTTSRGFADGQGVALLERLSERAGVDGWILVLREASGIRAYVWRADWPKAKVSALLPATSDGTQSLAAWTHKALKPVPKKPEGPRIVGYKEGFWSVDGYWLLSRVGRRLTGANGALESAFNGTGPRIQITANSDQGWRGFFIVDVLSYDIAPPTFRLADGTTITLGGGTGSRLEISGGKEWMIEGSARALLSIYADIGIWGERMNGKDVIGDTGALGVFPTLVFSGLMVRLGSRFWIPAVRLLGSPLEFSVHIWSSPLTYFSQIPDDAFGTSHSTRPVAGSRGHVAINPGNWIFSLGYESERREVFLEGDARAAYDPPLTSVRLNEITLSVVARMGRRF